MQTRIVGIAITLPIHNSTGGKKIKQTSNLNHLPNDEINVGMSNINTIQIMQTK